MKIAVTGGIACGKSLVAKFLRARGVATLDADDVVHELLPDPAERKRLAAEVFGNAEKRRELEARLHPQVKARLAAFLAQPMPPLRVVIVPLLFEVHWDAEYDIICCVASPQEMQIARMMHTRGYTRAEAEARLAAQLPVAEKASRSHYVIRNAGTVADLERDVTQFADWLAQQQSKRM